MLYNIDFALCGLAFAIIIAVHFFSKPRLRNGQNLIFGVLILVIIGDAIFDILAAIAISYPESVPMSINITFNQLYYFAQMCLAPLLYLYILSMTNLLIRKNSGWILISFLPFAYGFAIWLGNPVSGYFFYFDSALNYFRGPLMFSLYALSGYFIALVIALMIIKRKSLRNNQFYSMVVFLIFSVIVVIFQFLIPHLLITGLAASVALTMSYLTLQNPVETLDEVTGVFNRKALFQHLKENEKLEGIQHFVVISIDDFGGIMRNIGVDRGSRFLTSFVKFIKGNSKFAQIFRYTGDVFIVVFTSEKHLQDFVKSIKRRRLFPWKVGDLEIVIPLSLYYSDGIPPIRKEDRLSLIIDRIMYKGKKLGSRVALSINQKEIYEILRMHHIEDALRVALENDTLDVYFQPVYCPKSDMFVSVEALVRFTDKKMGVINLGDFIPLAEQNGMILQIGRQVMRKVCNFIDESKLYKDYGISRVMVNLSVQEAVRTDLVSTIEHCHKENNVPQGFIGFEITETSSSLGEELFIRNMSELVEKGFFFALDDFGTGYANLDSIIALPFKAVKLDGSLLYAGEKNEKIFIVFTEHIQMFKRMGLRVIVEGVETEEQVALLKDLPVDLIQGYYYAKPMPLEVAAAFIKEYNKGKSSYGSGC